jgi:uroporphyrinogen decarboxylase
MDVALTPGFVERLLRGIADYILGGMEILFDRFEFEAVAVSDDYGSQRDLLISPSDWRRFIRPLLEEIYGYARKHGRSVLHHSDGNICSIVGDLVEMGCDILHPVQPEAMDVFRLKREFGDDLTLMGAMRTQDLLPSGTPEEIRDEVRRLKDGLGVGGGYVVGNGITILGDVPIENMAAMIDEAVGR